MTSASYLATAVSALIAYLIGGLPFGYLFVRFSLGVDVRTIGSGNIGATNVHRAAGGKAGAIVLLLDILKGFVAVWLASVISPENAAAIAAAIVAVMLGHCYPVFLRFRGGKAVACFIGAFLFVAPAAILATALIFFVVFAATKYVSLSSIAGALVFPAVLWGLVRPAGPILAGSILAALLVVYRHKANIQRIRTGSEPAFSFKGGAAR